MKKTAVLFLSALLMLSCAAAAAEQPGRERTGTPILAPDEITAHAGSLNPEEQARISACPEPGTKISFSTTDLQHKAVFSDELFRKNRVTLISFRQAFCESCTEELAELDRLNREYADRGFEAVAVICDAGDDEEKQEEAGRISAGFSIRMILLSDRLEEALPAPEGTSASYFIGSDGSILGYPVEGKNPDEIRAGIERYLNGETAEGPADSAAVGGQLQTWTVRVTDQNGDPVPEVTVSFCTDSACHMTELDENGTGSFTGPANRYHLEVVDAPDGYSTDDAGDIFTEARSGEITITIVRESSVSPTAGISPGE